MILFKEYVNKKNIIIETTTAGDISLHLSHMEDLAIEQGKDGFVRFTKQITGLLNYIRGLDSNIQTSIKVDGAPAVYFGIDPRLEYKGQFFIALKSGFAKTPKINHTDFEIEQNYGPGSPLSLKLKIILKELAKGYDNSGLLYHGDLLFAGHNDKKRATLDGTKYLYVKPNVVAYAVPVDENSLLFNRINNAEVGIVIHAGYTAETNPDNTAIIPRLSKQDNFDQLIASGQSNNVFIEDSVLHNPINFEIPIKQTQLISQYLGQAQSYISQIDDEFDSIWRQSKQLDFLKMFLNNEVRSKRGSIFKAVIQDEEYDHDKFSTAFKKFISDRFEKETRIKKTERGIISTLARRDKVVQWIDDHYASFENLMFTTYYMMQIKKEFLKIFDNVEGKLGKMFTENPEDGSLEVTKGEGFVISIGNDAIKLVDRLDFSKLNFLQGAFQKGK